MGIAPGRPQEPAQAGCRDFGGEGAEPAGLEVPRHALEDRIEVAEIDQYVARDHEVLAVRMLVQRGHHLGAQRSEARRVGTECVRTVAISVCAVSLKKKK